MQFSLQDGNKFGIFWSCKDNKKTERKRFLNKINEKLLLKELKVRNSKNLNEQKLKTCNLKDFFLFSNWFGVFPEVQRFAKMKNESISYMFLFWFCRESSFWNKTPTDQQDIFRPNCSSNDTFWDSSHCTMKTHKFLMKKELTLFEYCHPISEANSSRTHQTHINTKT